MQLSDKIVLSSPEGHKEIEDWEDYATKNLNLMTKILNNLPKTNKDKKTIYVFHNPPYGIGLDVCMNGSQVGSKVILEFLKKSQAYMSLHGHIHESPDVSNRWNIDLNGTIAIQPGQTEIGSNKMNYVIIDTDKDKYERYVEKFK